MPEEEFLGLLAAVDEFGLVTLEPDVADRAGAALGKHPLGARLDLARLEKARGTVAEAGSLPLFVGASPAGTIKRAHDADEALTASVLLENLCGKATATLALAPTAPRQRHRSGVDRLRARLRRGSDRGSLPAGRRQPREGGGAVCGPERGLGRGREGFLRGARPGARHRGQSRIGGSVPARCGGGRRIAAPNSA